MNRRQIIEWLRQKEAAELEKLYSQADRVRSLNVGPEIHLRALIEFSNICSRRCIYCGISAYNNRQNRYQMSKDEIVQCAIAAEKLGYGTVVLQSGENKNMDVRTLAAIIKEIKDKTQLAVTLSVGEWDSDTYKLWKDAGADRFLLRFETSNDELYKRLHPDSEEGVVERFKALESLKRLGYEVGSGIMIGIPGQNYEMLAEDLLKFRELDLDMIGVGPFILHKDTPLYARLQEFILDEENQVPADEEMTYKVISISRILCPKANIPATTAIATLNRQRGRELALSRGANVVMLNVTPPAYRKMYDLYPGKICVFEGDTRIVDSIREIGRVIGTGKGASPNFLNRRCSNDREKAIQ